MKDLIRVILIRLDGISQIRLCWREKGLVELNLEWPDGVKGFFAGYTKSGRLKYREIENVKEL